MRSAKILSEIFLLPIDEISCFADSRIDKLINRFMTDWLIRMSTLPSAGYLFWRPALFQLGNQIGAKKRMFEAGSLAANLDSLAGSLVG